MLLVFLQHLKTVKSLMLILLSFWIQQANNIDKVDIHYLPELLIRGEVSVYLKLSLPCSSLIIVLAFLR